MILEIRDNIIKLYDKQLNCSEYGWSQLKKSDSLKMDQKWKIQTWPLTIEMLKTPSSLYFNPNSNLKKFHNFSIPTSPTYSIPAFIRCSKTYPHSVECWVWDLIHIVTHWSKENSTVSWLLKYYLQFSMKKTGLFCDKFVELVIWGLIFTYFRKTWKCFMKISVS